MRFLFALAAAVGGVAAASSETQAQCHTALSMVEFLLQSEGGQTEDVLADAEAYCSLIGHGATAERCGDHLDAGRHDDAADLLTQHRDAICEQMAEHAENEDDEDVDEDADGDADLLVEAPRGKSRAHYNRRDKARKFKGWSPLVNSAAQIECADDRNVWVLSRGGRVFHIRHRTKKAGQKPYVQVPGRFRDIATSCGTHSRVATYGADMAGKVHMYRGRGKWAASKGGPRGGFWKIAAGRRGDLWGIAHRTGRVWRLKGSKWVPLASTQRLSQMSVGCDRSVLGVTPAGKVVYYSSRTKTFRPLRAKAPRFTTVDVVSAKRVYATTRTGRVYGLVRGRWHRQHGVLMNQISVAFRGGVCGVYRGYAYGKDQDARHHAKSYSASIFDPYNPEGADNSLFAKNPFSVTHQDPRLRNLQEAAATTPSLGNSPSYVQDPLPFADQYGNRPHDTAAGYAHVPKPVVDAVNDPLPAIERDGDLAANSAALKYKPGTQLNQAQLTEHMYQAPKI